ncbi:hypothetical protein GDO86_015417 [Hymenochirus boettgeri]|uniref:Uncharacterized protein n=1 Tax=Hymenochirus boettgeri TaxID=247094 RepID=A0A8T2K174_9PIPI|nr:hypothetical protein GDO86_015417 [Hymenochirus boettgeri]
MDPPSTFYVVWRLDGTLCVPSLNGLLFPLVSSYLSQESSSSTSCCTFAFSLTSMQISGCCNHLINQLFVHILLKRPCHIN